MAWARDGLPAGFVVFGRAGLVGFTAAIAVEAAGFGVALVGDVASVGALGGGFATSASALAGAAFGGFALVVTSASVVL